MLGVRIVQGAVEGDKLNLRPCAQYRICRRIRCTVLLVIIDGTWKGHEVIQIAILDEEGG